MADYAEAAHLDREVVQRVAISYAGYGAYLEREAEQLAGGGPFHEGMDSSGTEKREETEEVDRLIHGAASSYNIAGSYFALIHPSAASLMFWAAARAYLRLRRVYGGVLAACAREVNLLRAYSHLVLEHAYAPREIPYAAITIAALAQLNGSEFKRELGRVIEEAGPWRATLLPDIQIPFGLFLDVFRDVSFGEGSRVEGWPRSANVLLERFDEQFAAAQANSYRWKLMQERFLPIQPEVLASIMLTRERFDSPELRREGKESSRFQELRAARILLRLSEEMIESRPFDLELGFPGQRVPEAMAMLFQQWREYRG
jgi:hypothetical protein